MISQNSISKESAADQPIPQTLIEQLSAALADMLGGRYGSFRISLLSHATSVADGTTVLLIRDLVGQPRAVALCSSPVAPDMVRRAMDRARAAKEFLGASIGSPILEPLTEGSVGGLSYAVLPYCNELSKRRPIWWLQRTLLRPLILDWLWRVTEHSVRAVDSAAINRSFVKPLHSMASLDSLSGNLRTAAESAAGRLDAGAWTPKHVLMHGDLWKGNILIRSSGNGFEPRRWRDRYVIIDWAGSKISGHAMYDLVRLAESMSLTDRCLRREVDRHCRILECDPANAAGYLLAALGHIYMNLEHFPVDRFVRMAENSLATLERSLTS